jgi:hypothetical protein
MTLTLDGFRATKRSADDELWAMLDNEGVLPNVSRDDCFFYGNKDNAYLIHVEGGKFMVHAWWYSPLGYDTLEVAEAHLFDWYVELN